LSADARIGAFTDFFSAHPGSPAEPWYKRLLDWAGDYDAEGTGFGLGLIQFTQWEANSGRLSPQQYGSSWWEAVNGRMVLDVQAAGAWVDSFGSLDAASAALGSSGLTPSTAAWVEYAIAAGSNQSDDYVQFMLWEAHQMSIHTGIGCAWDLYDRENVYERNFIDIVMRNVDLAALLNFSTVDAGLGVYISKFYPGYGDISGHDLQVAINLQISNVLACGHEVQLFVALFTANESCVSGATATQVGMNSDLWP
jgi:hypothetical protein